MTCKEKLDALQVVVIIPTYNNGGTVAKTVADVREYAEHVIVVNDGSTDGSREMLQGMEGIVLLDYEKNRGKGYAVRLGLEYAYKSGYRYAITIDADGQHYADDIQVFVDGVEENPDILLVGARNLNAENMPSQNTFANKFSNFWYRLETGQELADTQSGYRLYPLHKIHDMHFLGRRYEFEVEVIVRAAWRDVAVKNVPVKVYYAPKEERVSHFRPFKDFMRISVVNTVLVLCALLFYYPWKFLRALTWGNVKNFFDRQVLHSADSDVRMAASMALGVFCGIIPIWGYQMIVAGLSAHFLRLNKVVAVVFSNISIPPCIPFILYGSMALGAALMGAENVFSWNSISWEAVAESLWQYLLGSFALAFLAGAFVFLLSFCLMFLFKRSRG